MSDVVLNDDNLNELLGKENSARSLYYDCQAKVDWCALGRAFPKLTQFDINHWDNEIPRRILDASFFLAFPYLTKLNAGDWLMDFRGLKSKQIPFINDWRGGVLARGEDLGIMLSRCGEHIKTVVIDAGTVTLTAKHKVKAFNLTLELGKEVTALDIELGSEKPGAFYIKQKRAAAPLNVVNFIAHQVEYLQLSLDKLGQCKLALPERMKQLDISARSCGDDAELLLHRLAEADDIELDLPFEQSPSQPYPDLKRLINFSLSLPKHAGPIPAQWLDGIESVSNRLQLHQPVDYPGFSALLQRCNLLRRVSLPALEAESVEALSGATNLSQVEILPAAAESALWPKLPQVKRLTLVGMEGAALPQPIRQMTQLEELELKDCRLSGLGDLSAMTALAELSIEVNPKSEPAKALCYQPLLSLPKLRQFYLAPHPEGVAPLALLQLPELRWRLDIPKRSRRSEQLMEEVGILARSLLTLEEKQRGYRALYDCAKVKEFVSEDIRLILTFLEKQYKPLNGPCLQGLERHGANALEQTPIDHHSCLFICGKSGFKAAELNAKAIELGFSLSKTLDDSVTHVVVGKKPTCVHRIDPARHVIIDDGALGAWLRQAKPEMLQQQDEGTLAMVDNVLAMLRSPDTSAHKVAAQMLEQCGVAPTLRMPLFYVLKTTKDKALREQVRSLLRGQGDGLFQQAIGDTVLFYGDVDSDSGESEFYKRLKRRVKHWGIELCLEFAWEYFQHQGDGLLLLLEHKEDTPQRREAILSLVEGDCLNWRRGAGFYKLVEQGNDKQRMDYHRSPDIFLVDRGCIGSLKAPLPEWLPQQQVIRELNMGNCYLGQLPKGIEHYSELTKLNLSFNHIEELPSKLAKLKQLQELDLSYNHFYEFPEVIMKLKSLKKLDLRCATRPSTFGTYQEDYEPLRAPEALRKAMPDLEILED